MYASKVTLAMKLCYIYFGAWLQVSCNAMQSLNRKHEHCIDVHILKQEAINFLCCIQYIIQQILQFQIYYCPLCVWVFITVAWLITACFTVTLRGLINGRNECNLHVQKVHNFKAAIRRENENCEFGIIKIQSLWFISSEEMAQLHMTTCCMNEATPKK